MKKKKPVNNNWIGGLVMGYFAFVVMFTICIGTIVTSCSPKIVEHTVTRIEYRDRVVHDTAKFEILKEVEKVVTRDTSSILENDYAKSEAVVSEGFLHHSLESKPKTIYVPVEVHVTDTVWVEQEAKEIIKEVPVEKPLSVFEKAKIDYFWYVFIVALALLVYVFRKPLFRLLKLVIPTLNV